LRKEKQVNQMKLFLKKHIVCFLLKIFVITVGLFFSACGTSLERVPVEQIDLQQKQFAEKMANMILGRCVSYDYSALPIDEVNEAMVKGFNATVFQQTCEFLRDKYGRFRGLEFVEAMQPPNSNEYIIYRFKGNFKEAIKFPEVRITIDQSGKLAGFNAAKWNDKL